MASEAAITIWSSSGWMTIDVADPNTDAGGDRSTLITAVLGIYMSSKAQLRVAYEHQSFQGDVTPAISGVRSALTVNF